jgi:hypothetical protein
VKDENGDLLADSHNILSRWKNYLNGHNVNDVRHKENTVEPLVPNPTPFQVQIGIANLKRDK